MREIESDRKAERLINLTMALLSAPRYLTKSEIFARVSGYEDDGTSLDSMSRKFERDKDDLRALGIDLEVGTNSAAHDDEQGYRIARSTYGLSLQSLDREEYSLISIAIAMWRNEYFSEQGQSALRKIQGIGLDFVEPTLPTNLFTEEVPHESFALIWDAISQKKMISFTYQSSKTSNRTLAPYTLTLWHNFWYVTGLDIDRQEIRTFKLVRIQSNLHILTTSPLFDIPENFSVRDYLKFHEGAEEVEVNFEVREGQALALRTTSTISPSDIAGWDRASKKYPDSEVAIQDLVQYGSSIRILAPNNLRDEYLRRISRALKFAKGERP